MTDSALVAAGPPTVVPFAASGMTEAQILEKLQAVGDVLAPEAKLTAVELQLFAMVSARNGLDPFAKQIYAIRRQGKLTFQTGIDGYRSIAAREAERRGGHFAGSDTPVFGPWIEGRPGSPGVIATVGHPEWAEVTVHHRLADGVTIDQTARAWWDEYVPGPPNDFRWKQAPRGQLAKCAEALALRMLFPYVLADLYVEQEMDRSASDEKAAAETARVAAMPTASDRVAERRAALEARKQRPAPTGPPDEEPPLPNAPSGPAAGASVTAGMETPAAGPVSGEVIESRAVACESASPYGAGGGPCGLAKGHAGFHRNRDKETWS